MISDMRMPVMDARVPFSNYRNFAPDSIRVMLTGYADTEAAMRAVNEAESSDSQQAGHPRRFDTHTPNNYPI